MADTFHHESTKVGKHENYLVFFRVFVISWFRDLFFCNPARPGWALLLDLSQPAAISFSAF
jgi:hypothetical protein